MDKFRMKNSKSEILHENQEVGDEAVALGTPEKGKSNHFPL